MKNLKFLLLGLALSLFTIPAFAVCPTGFTELGPTLCGIGNEAYSVSSTIQNGVETWWISESGISVDSDLGAFLLSKVGQFPDGTLTFDFTVEQYADTGYSGSGPDYSGVDFFQIDTLDVDGFSLLGINPMDGFFLSAQGVGIWDNFLAGGFYTPLAPSGSSPSVLFNIDGIKDNIFATLLTLILGLLLVVVFNYAWRSAREMLWGNAYFYERSPMYGKDGWRVGPPNKFSHFRDIAPKP